MIFSSCTAGTDSFLVTAAGSYALVLGSTLIGCSATY